MEKSRKDLLEEIKALKKQLKALSGSKKPGDRYHNAFSEAADPILFLDNKGKITEANHAFCKLIGYKSTELVGKPIKGFFDPEDLRKIPLRLSALLSGKTVVTERVFLSKAGKKIDTEVSYRVVSEKEIFGVVRPSGDRKKLYRALLENEVKTKIFLEKSPAEIWTTDEKLNISSYTSKGRSVKKNLGKNLISLYPGKPENYEPVSGHQKALKGISVKYVHTVDSKVYESVLEPLKDHSEKIIGVLGCSFDITEKVDSQEALLRNEQLFRMIAENTDDVVFKISYSENFTYKYDYISPSIYKLTGYKASEYYKNPMLSATQVHPDDIKIIQGVLPPKEERKGVLIRRYVNRSFHKNGEVLFVETVNSFFFDQSGRLLSIIGVSRNITDRKIAEAKLRDSEERFRKMADATLEGIVIHQNGQIIDVNRAFCKLLEYKESELIGKSAITLVSEEYQEDLKKRILERRLESYEVVGISKSGKRIIAELTPREVEVEGKIIRIVAVRDISLQKQQEQALSESEEQYRFLFQKSPLPMWVYDAEDYKIVNVNETACKHYGYSRGEFIGMSLFDIRPEREREGFMKHVQKTQSVMEVEPFHFGTWTHVKKDGTEIIVQVTKGLMKFKGKQLNIVTITDITDRIKQQALLKEKEESFRMLADNAIDIVYRYNLFPTPHYEYVSPSVFHMTGYKPEEFYADPYLGFKIVHPDDQEIVKESEPALREGKTISELVASNTVVRWITKSGEAIWTETKNRPVTDDEGRLIRIEGISRNITDRIKLENELIESKETYKALLETIPAGVLIFSEGRLLYANPAALAKFGFRNYKSIIAEGLSIFDFILPEYHHRIKLANDRVMAGDTLPYLEIKARRLDDQVIDIETRSVLVNYKGKQCIQAIFHDISYRKRIEQSIRESEERFRILSEVSLEGIVFSDDKGLILDTNDRFLDLFNYRRREQIINKPLQKILNCSDDAINKIRELSDSVYELEVRKDGKRMFAEFKTSFIPMNGTQIYATVIKDITARKDYEREIESSRQSYKQLIESSPDGVLIYRAGKVVFVNPAALEIFEEKNASNIVGKSVRSLIPDNLKDLSAFTNVKSAGIEPVHFNEVTVTTRSGKSRIIETKSLFLEYLGQPSVMVVLHDTSEKKQLIREQLRAQIAEETNFKLQEEILRHEKTQKLLVDTQKYTRNIIESSIDIICAADNQGLITEFNRAAQTTFGYSLEEVLGKPIEILYAHYFDQEKVTSEISGTGLFKGEILNRKKNGEVFLAYLTASSLVDETGVLVGTMGISRDITKLKMAEEALRLSEEKYRAIYNQVFIGIAMVGLNGKFIQANQQLCKMFGYSEEELSEKSFTDITYPLDIEKSIAFRDDLLSGKRSNFTVEKRYLHKDGSIVQAILTSSVVYNDKNEPEYFLSVFHDITDQRRVEEQVRIQSSKLNAIFETSSHLIWTIDRNFCLTSFNRNYTEYVESIYGVKPTVGMAENSGKMVSTEEYNNFWNNKYQEVFKGTPQHFETSMTDLEGNIRWNEIYLNPIFTSSERVIEVSGIAHDITEKKLAEERIYNSLREKEVLLKEVHHRVKNNLQVISSILNLQSSYVKDKNTLEMLRESQDRIKSMSFIHESLYQAKDFSKINFSEYIINLSKNLLHSYRIYDGQVKLEIEADTVFMNLDYAIPSGLIINELVSNSFKYAFPKDRNGRVGITMREVAGKIYLTIEDDGVGLPEKIDFRNTESLGLQLVCTLVDQLNGEIHLDRKSGAKYIITFNKEQKII